MCVVLEDEISFVEEWCQNIMLQIKINEVEVLWVQMVVLQVEKIECGMVFILGDVLFDFNKVDLKVLGQCIVVRLVEFMLQYEDRWVWIEGYIDSIGEEFYNCWLLECCVMVVYDELLSYGVFSSCVEVEGYGEVYLVVSNQISVGC